MNPLDSILTVVATPVKAQAPKPGRKFQSRFFYLDETTRYEKLKKAVKPKKPELENKELVALENSMGKTLTPSVKANITVVRDFFLEEIAPLTLALGAGSQQAQSLIKNFTGSPVEQSTFTKFDRMCHTAVCLRMADFLVTYMKLPAEAKPLLVEALKPALPKAQIPIPERNGSAPAPVRSQHKETRALTQALTHALANAASITHPTGG